MDDIINILGGENDRVYAQNHVKCRHVELGEFENGDEKSLLSQRTFRSANMSCSDAMLLIGHEFQVCQDLLERGVQMAGVVKVWRKTRASEKKTPRTIWWKFKSP